MSRSVGRTSSIGAPIKARFLVPILLVALTIPAPVAAEPPTTFGIGDALVAVGDADQLHPYRYARRSGGFYRPDALLEGIAPHAADPAAGIVDFHLYTFNAVDATEKWRQAYLTKLGAAVAAA